MLIESEITSAPSYSAAMNEWNIMLNNVITNPGDTINATIQILSRVAFTRKPTRRSIGGNNYRVSLSFETNAR